MMSAKGQQHGPNDGHNHGSGGTERPWELYFAIASGVTYIAGTVAEYAFQAPESLTTPLFLATYFFGGFFTVIEAVRSVRRGRFEVDFLMIVAAIGAGAVGRFGEGAVLLFLFSLGHALEEYALSRAKKSIEALGALAPRTATVRVGDGTEERDVEQLVVGDVLVVRPNSRVPADGIVSVGVTAIDQSAVTGESIPVEKSPATDLAAAIAKPESVGAESRVFAGTVNGPGAFDMIVTAVAADSTLARVVKLVQEADTAQSPTQRFIDRFQRVYVPVVIAAVLGVLAFGLWVLGDPFDVAFYRAMLVLVAASPCALAIATPAAVLAGIARAARAGVLVKGGAPLEELARVKALAFDKTGTLTWGHPSVTDVVPAPGVSDDELRRVAVAVEEQSDHPLATAIVRDLADSIPAGRRATATDLEAVTGRGVRARVDGRAIMLGNVRMMTEAGQTMPAELASEVDRLQNEGRTTLVLWREDGFLGVIAVMARPRREARETLEKLRADGVSELVLISGDNQQVAEAVGRAVAVDTAMGELLPEDKVTAIDRLGAENRRTAMVGDGVNDAPAMARANVGIAMGAAGSTVALETADIALMSDDLGRVPYVRRLSRATSNIIRQNLIASLVIVAFLVPASLIGLDMGPIVFIHEGSTILVVLNALRLLRFEAGREHEGVVHEDRPGKD